MVNVYSGERELLNVKKKHKLFEQIQLRENEMVIVRVEVYHIVMRKNINGVVHHEMQL